MVKMGAMLFNNCLFNKLSKVIKRLFMFFPFTALKRTRFTSFIGF